MLDSETNDPGERPEGTGSWRPLATPTAEGLDLDPPTVRSGNSAGSAGSGSSVARRKGGILPLPEVGDQIDTFSLEEVIGAGGMGAVYRALDIRLDRRVALKILPPEQGYDAETVQRFYQEARAAARLDHENIARVFTIGHDGQYHYIAFEYIEGTNVRLRVSEHGPLPVGEAINYTLQIANALVHAAERGVVHRDIKPSNIIITPQGRAKLVDMGLARQFERGGVDDGLTQSGMTLGTFDYISPEQARDPRNVDVRSDLYSLGCTLFHMLTGRPPFPDGTVLQKLIQHQEEPAPDVRSLNPGVPADLAAILLKLMAKDRDRRYQTPEQLARDLLTVAGALGLRSVSPEGLIWMAGESQVSWERHLIWAVPTAALALVVLTLVWWGQPANEGMVSPPLIEAIAPPPPPPRVAPVVPEVADEPREVEPIESTPRVAAEAGTVAEVPAPARDFTLRAGDDLAAVLASAPSGAIVTLSDDGPYDLRPSAIDRKDAGKLAGRDLTLRASAGVRPILRVSRDSDADADDGADAALVRVVGGRVVLEGLEFAVDPGDREGSLAAVFAEDADLTIRRCLFRRIGPPLAGGRVAALHLLAHPRADLEDRPSPTRIVASHFDGGQTGIQARGPAAIDVVDTTFGPDGTAVSFDQESSLNAGLARLGLRHVSIMAGDGPVFRFVRTPAVVRIDDSVVSSTGTGRPVLVATDDPDRLDWLGRGNLYGALDTYLLPTRTLTGRDPIRAFDEWSDGPSGPRETDSVADDAPVWAETNLLAALARSDPSAAFALPLDADLDAANPGVRRGPFGVIAHPAERLAQVAEPERSPRVRPLEPSTPAVPALPVETPDGPMTVEPMPESRTAPMFVEVPPMPAVDARPERDPEVPDEPERPIEQPAAESTPRPSGPEPARSTTDSAPIRTTAELIEALRRPTTKGGTIRLAADADLILPACDVPGLGSWIIQADSEKNGVRPRIRFRPGDGLTAAQGRTALFRLRAGSLELRGIDVVLPEDEAPPRGRWAAFAVWAGADLNLTRCTVTVEGDQDHSALVIVQAGEDEIENGLAHPDSAAALVRATDCLLRAGGDLVDVAAGRRLDLELENTVIASGGSLVHGHGLARGQTAEPLKLVMRRVAARNGGGLVRLESEPGEPELPSADVVARESIVATTPDGGPLFLVDEQESNDPPRDRIRWQGHGVTYHRISTYRLDQSAQPGSMPARFDRPAWEVAVGPREVDPVHNDARFLDEWDPARSIWTLAAQDVRLSADSPASGPDLSLIPEPPRSD